MLSLSINVCKIPKEKLFISQKGVKYLNIVVFENDEPDQYGNTHSVAISQTKEERAAKAKKIYIGNGKEFSDRPRQAPRQQQQNNNTAPYGRTMTGKPKKSPEASYQPEDGENRDII